MTKPTDDDLEIEMPVDSEMVTKPDEKKTKTESTMEVKLRGSTESVRRQLGIEQDKKPGNGEPTPDDVTFLESLKDHNNVVIVKRISPRVWGEQKINVEVYRQECPLQISDIEEEISTNHGGKKFRVAVIDNRTGDVIAARVLANDADPIVPAPDMSQEEINRMFNVPGPKTPTEQTAEHIEKQTQLAIKQAELEDAQARLDDMRTRRTKPVAPVVPPGATDADKRIAALEAALAEQRHENQIAALRGEVNALKTVQVAPKADGEITALLKQMAEDRKASDEKFSKLVQSMNDQKLADIQRSIESLKNKPKEQGQSLLDQVDVLLKLKRVMGWDGGGEDNDDPDKPWYEKLADKYLPDLIDIIKERSEKGDPMSREEIAAEFNRAADAAAAKEVAKIRGQKLPAALPPPQPPAALPPPQPQTTVPEPTIAAAPGAVPAPASPTPTPAPAPGASPMPTVDDEIKIRVAQCMAVLDRECQMRPRQWTWNEIFWSALPEFILERVCVASDPDGIIAALDGILKPEAMAMMKQKFAEPRTRMFVARGLDELRDWGAKAAQDPSFDPFAEEEVEE